MAAAGRSPSGAAVLEAAQGAQGAARGAHNTPSEVYVFFAYVAYGSLYREILRVAYVLDVEPVWHVAYTLHIVDVLTKAVKKAEW